MKRTGLPSCVCGVNFHFRKASAAGLVSIGFPLTMLTDSTSPSSPTTASTSTGPSILSWRAIGGYTGETFDATAAKASPLDSLRKVCAAPEKTQTSKRKIAVASRFMVFVCILLTSNIGRMRRGFRNAPPETADFARSALRKSLCHNRIKGYEEAPSLRIGDRPARTIGAAGGVAGHE